MELITSEQLEQTEIEGFESITEQGQFRYQMTDAELGWLTWIGDRCSISEYLWQNTTVFGVATIDVWEIGDALRADGVDRAPCLSDDTQLQRLIWYIGPHGENEAGT